MDEEEKTEFRSLKKEIRQELKLGEAELEPKEIARHNSNILERVFYLVFKILQLKEPSKFLHHSLQAVLKFVHLINVELISNLLKLLIQAANSFRSNKLKNNKFFLARLECVLTAEEVIQGPGQVLEIDDKEAAMHFYQILRDY